LPAANGRARRRTRPRADDDLFPIAHLSYGRLPGRTVDSSVSMIGAQAAQLPAAIVDEARPALLAASGHR